MNTLRKDFGMRTTTKYEEICAEYIHRKANKDNWPFYDPVTYLNLLGMGEELTGKEYICIWQREEEVITKECGCIDDFLGVPSDALTISKHEIESDWYDQNRCLIEQ